MYHGIISKNVYLKEERYVFRFIQRTSTIRSKKRRH